MLILTQEYHATTKSAEEQTRTGWVSKTDGNECRNNKVKMYMAEQTNLTGVIVDRKIEVFIRDVVGGEQCAIGSKKLLCSFFTCTD